MVAVGYRVFLSTSSTSTILVQPIIINLHMFKPQIYVIVKNLSCEYVNVFFSQKCIKIQLVISGVLEEDRKKKKNKYLNSCFFFSIKRYLQPSQRFFRRMLEPGARVTADVYAYMFLCDFFNFLVVIFGFAAFGVISALHSLLYSGKAQHSAVQQPSQRFFRCIRVHVPMRLLQLHRHNIRHRGLWGDNCITFYSIVTRYSIRRYHHIFNWFKISPWILYGWNNFVMTSLLSTYWTYRIRLENVVLFGRQKAKNFYINYVLKLFIKVSSSQLSSCPDASRRRRRASLPRREQGADSFPDNADPAVRPDRHRPSALLAQVHAGQDTLPVRAHHRRSYMDVLCTAVYYGKVILLTVTLDYHSALLLRKYYVVASNIFIS